MVGTESVPSGAKSPEIELQVGPNIIATTVSDGITTNTYSIVVTRQQTPTLINLVLSSDANPAIPRHAVAGSNYADYTATVPNATSRITITPTAAYAGYTVMVGTEAVPSGAKSPEIELQVGPNIIVTTVSDGITTNTYGIVVTRQAPIGLVMKYEEQSQPIVASNVTVHQNLSPNGDGNSDVLVIDGITAYPDNKVQIMSRSGVLIYDAKGYNNMTKVFDGHSSTSGKLQQAGTYFYSLEYKDGNETKHKTGFIVLKY
jgi:gliding motility-associated-like protein